PRPRSGCPSSGRGPARSADSIRRMPPRARPRKARSSPSRLPSGRGASCPCRCRYRDGGRRPVVTANYEFPVLKYRAAKAVTSAPPRTSGWCMRKLLFLAILLALPVFAQPSAPGQYVLRMEIVRAGFTLQNMTPEEAGLLTQHGAYLKSLREAGTL